MVIAMALQSARISSRARPMRWLPKKSQDQAALRASWTRNAPSAQGGAGEPAAFPDEPRRDRHEAVQHGPDDAEHPAGRRERGLGELVVPRPRLEPRAERRHGVAERQPADEPDPGPPPHAVPPRETGARPAMSASPARVCCPC